MASEMTSGERVCTICEGEFDLDKEGGVDGYIGILAVAFCPTCKAGVMDFADQCRLPEECPHCGMFPEDDEMAA